MHVHFSFLNACNAECTPPTDFFSVAVLQKSVVKENYSKIVIVFLRILRLIKLKNICTVHANNTTAKKKRNYIITQMSVVVVASPNLAHLKLT